MSKNTCIYSVTGLGTHGGRILVWAPRYLKARARRPHAKKKSSFEPCSNVYNPCNFSIGMAILF